MKRLEEWIDSFQRMGRLGDVLTRHHKITQQHLTTALDIQREQKAAGGKVAKIGEILIANKSVTENDILDIYEKELGLPRLHNASLQSLDHLGMSREIFSSLFSLNEMEEHEFLLYALEASSKDKDTSEELSSAEEVKFFCLIHDPQQAITLRQMLHNKLTELGGRFSPLMTSQSNTGTESFLKSVEAFALYVTLARRGDILRIVEDLKGNRSSMEITTEHAHSTSQLWKEVCQFGIAQGCSDIHVAPYGSNGGLRVRFRRDGEVIDESKFMYGSEKFSSMDYEEFVNVLFDRATGMDRLRMTMTAQDGAIQEQYKNKIHDIRLASIPITMETTKSCKLTLRIHAEHGTKDFDNIGLLPHQMKTVRHLYSQQSGLFLMTGPTSSGKTTTLHAILRRLDLDKQTCYTIEDPVEHKLLNAYQIQVNEKEGLTFPAVLRNLLRQDLNIVMVGEMRDPESVQLVLDIANTGHSVFSSIHANSAYKVPQRLFNMGVMPFQLFSSLNGIISQRLVLKNCKNCLVDYVPTDKEARFFGLTSDMTYKRGSGMDSSGNICPFCEGRGHEGRVGVFEILPLCMYPAWEHHADSPEHLKAFFDEIRDESGRILFPDLLSDARQKMAMGWISPRSLLEAFSRFEA